MDPHRFVIPVQLAAVDVGAAFEIGLCRSGISRGFPVPTSSTAAMAVAAVEVEGAEAGRVDAPASIEMTLRMTFSTLWTGLQRSDACSYIVGSSPGVCKMEMQTVPSG